MQDYYGRRLLDGEYKPPKKEKEEKKEKKEEEKVCCCWAPCKLQQQ